MKSIYTILIFPFDSSVKTTMRMFLRKQGVQCSVYRAYILFDSKRD
jgi:hypothetical protein